MKKCPFCAEEIQDAAIKCRYCGSNLGVGPDLGASKDLAALALPDGARRNGAVVARVIGTVFLLLLAVVLVFAMIGESRQPNPDPQLEAFKLRRADWHRRCDDWVNIPISVPAAKACNTELNSMVAEGKAHGW